MKIKYKIKDITIQIINNNVTGYIAMVDETKKVDNDKGITIACETIVDDLLHVVQVKYLTSIEGVYLNVAQEVPREIKKVVSNMIEEKVTAYNRNIRDLLDNHMFDMEF